MLNERGGRSHRGKLNVAPLLIFKMSISSWFRTSIAFRRKEVISTLWVRGFCTAETETETQTQTQTEPEEPKDNRFRPVHPLEKCIEYMDSEAYKYTYGDKPVWHTYIRNFKGSLPPRTRDTCVIGGIITVGSPCPICRDQYLLPHYTNVKLLKQFVSPYGGEILDSKKTKVCQKQYVKLIVAIKKAQNYGLLSFTVPHRSYDYSLYTKK